MKTLTRHLSGTLLQRFFWVLFGLLAFLLSIDLLLNSDELLTGEDGSLEILLRYATLRLPGIISQCIPIAFMIAGIILLVGLVRHREMISAWNCGSSPFGVFRAFLPAAVLCGVLQIAVDDLALPPTLEELNDWGIGDFGKRPGSYNAGDVLWLRTGIDILRLPNPNLDSAQFEDVLIVRRHLDGQLDKLIEAKRADYLGGQWRLSEVTVRDGQDGAVESRAEMIWSTALAIDSIKVSLTHPSELPMHVMPRFFDNSTFGYWPLASYKVWFHERLATSFTPLLLILILVMLAQSYQLRRGLGALVLSALAHGFAYFIFDRAALALGEAQLVPAVLAAWGPSVVLFLLAANYGFRHERHALAENPSAT